MMWTVVGRAEKCVFGWIPPGNVPFIGYLPPQVCTAPRSVEGQGMVVSCVERILLFIFSWVVG